MNKAVLLLVVLLSFACLAQTAEPTLPPGFRFPGQMINHLDARKSKVGDEVKLELTNSIDGPGGTVAIPKGAKFIGTVTSVTDRKSGDGESRISFLVTKAEWRGGSMVLHAVPDAVTAPRMRTVGGAAGSGSGSGGDMGGGDSGRFGGDRPATAGAGRGGSGRGDDMNAMIGQAIAQELKGCEVKDSGDPKTVAAIVNSKRDVSLPSGTVVTLRQVKPPTE